MQGSISTYLVDIIYLKALWEIFLYVTFIPPAKNNLSSLIQQQP